MGWSTARWLAPWCLRFAPWRFGLRAWLLRLLYDVLVNYTKVRRKRSYQIPKQILKLCAIFDLTSIIRSRCKGSQSTKEGLRWSLKYIRPSFFPLAHKFHTTPIPIFLYYNYFYSPTFLQSSIPISFSTPNSLAISLSVLKPRFEILLRENVIIET